MKCEECGRDSTSRYVTDFVAARGRTYRAPSGFHGVSRVVTEFNDARRVTVSLCDDCFWTFWLHEEKVGATVVSVIFLVLTLVLLITASVATSRMATWMIYALVGLIWAVVLWFFWEPVKRHRRRDVRTNEIPNLMKRYFAKRMGAGGLKAEFMRPEKWRNVVFTPEEWEKEKRDQEG